jgi:hypothetical protein
VDADQLFATAMADTGKDLLGPEQDEMVEALGVLIESLNEDGDLAPEGETNVAAAIGSLLKRRLEIEDWYARHPEIEDQQIESILFGVGLPRTGSTALSCLLAKDANTRPLRQWEVSAPTPPPDLASEASDPRLLAMKQAMSEMANVPSELRSMLPTLPDGPAECLDLMAMTFRSMVLDVMAKTPSYGKWLLGDCDFRPAYRYHRRVLKLLQWRRPPSRWRVKTPAHLLSIEALDSVYPDARFVMTHRPVSRVIPSVASVEAAVIRMVSGNPDLAYLGRHAEETWDVALRRFIAFRDRVGDDRFYDIAFDNMQSDPMAAMEGLYDWLGEELTTDTRAAMEAWLKANEEERQQAGQHRYEAADFDLDLGELEERFGYYEARFPIARGR